MKKTIILSAFALLASCTSVQNTPSSEPFTWEGANLYFLVTDRFNNGNPNNDINFNRTEKVKIGTFPSERF